ncbi:hypothetical protein DPEC_G00374020 [Dallia pectoralis]|nr:hypothetical protein DPEC_G00374020 [Dallia pectoralis]
MALSKHVHTQWVKGWQEITHLASRGCVSMDFNLIHGLCHCFMRICVCIVIKSGTSSSATTVTSLRSDGHTIIIKNYITEYTNLY